MLKNENIICISSIDWDFIWQGHQGIMSALAKNGNRVLFIENTGARSPRFRDIPRLKKRIISYIKSAKGFRQVRDGLYVYSPLILPFPYSKICRWINRQLFFSALLRWTQVMDFHKPIVWTFLPTGIALDIINILDRKLLIYYCIADFYELVNNPQKVKNTEDELIKKSNLIFAMGEILGEKCRRLNNNVHNFLFGVNAEVFNNFQYSFHKTPEDIMGISKPIIGYIGGIHRHIDFKLVRRMAQEHLDWSIVLIGPIQTDISQISNLNNIFLLGKKEFPELPAYLAEFNACIIPYQLNEYTQTVYPTKLNEYHIMGKPVVSTDLPEVREFNRKNENLVMIGKTQQEFIEHISMALRFDKEELKNRRKVFACKNNWSDRIEEMSSLIEDALAKQFDTTKNWQEKFLRFYITARKKILKIGAILTACYLLLFYTPLIWLIAEPLRISQSPKKGDAIVVFAGGVGESGNAGQGYEERVSFAVDLYKQGYADNLIFSSGYTYAFKEPLMMKTLALSLGAKESAIILEDEASNTYENVNFVAKILAEKGWKEILLVSSAYHMRRVSFVFNKIAKDINVNYAPIPKSIFYSHEDRDSYGRKNWKRINLQQINGILHEYLGMLYYWRKGYI